MCHIDYPSTRGIRSISPVGAHLGVFGFVFVFSGWGDCAESPSVLCLLDCGLWDGDKRAVHTYPRFGRGDAVKPLAATTAEVIVAWWKCGTSSPTMSACRFASESPIVV